MSMSTLNSTMTIGGGGDKNIKKRTLIKERVGCSRATTYDLPPVTHTYGKKLQTDFENASEIIANWQTCDPSSGKESSKMIVFSNILAISRGCVTAKAIRQYAIDHPHIRRKESLHNTSARRDAEAMLDGPFGAKTIVNPEDKMKDIVEGAFHDWSTDDLDYPKKTSAGNVIKLQRPRSTAASNGIMLAREMERMKSTPHQRFTMKRFQNVPGVLDWNDPDTLIVKSGSRRKLKPLNNNNIKDALQDYNSTLNQLKNGNENIQNQNRFNSYDTNTENYQL